MDAKEAAKAPMVEIGATFIHGIEDNPIMKLAKHYKLPTTAVNYDSVKVIDSRTGEPFADDFVEAVKDSVYNVARRIFFVLRDKRIKEGLVDVPLDALFKDAVHIALHGFASDSGKSGYPIERRSLLRSLKVTDIEPALAKLLGKRLANKSNTTERNATLPDIQQVLSWHFYWEIVQDQIAPLNDLGSYAYDRSLGFRGPDHIFDNPRGIQALLDALIADLLASGGLGIGKYDTLPATSCSEVADTLATVQRQFRPGGRRLIVSLNCSVSQITDNQLPSVQADRRAEMQTILNNKRLAHRKELLGGAGKPATAGESSPTPPPTSDFGTESTATNPDSISGSSVHAAASDMILSVNIPIFALISLFEVADSLVWLGISNVIVPAAQALMFLAARLAKIIGAFVTYVELCHLSNINAERVAERVAECDFLNSMSSAVWAISGSHHSTPYFDPEESHATYTPNGPHPLTNLLPHCLRTAALEKRDMRKRFLQGEDPVLDRSEVMAERKRLGSERARLGLDGSEEDSAAPSGKVKRRKKPAPRPEDRVAENTVREPQKVPTFIEAAQSRIHQWISFTRKKITAVLRNTRRQYREVVRRPTSALNKATYLLKDPLAALRLLLLGEPIVATLAEVGVIELSNFQAIHYDVTGQALTRSVTGIRTSVGQGQALSSPAGGGPSIWWDSDVVVVAVPLGVLQRSVSLTSASTQASAKSQSQQSIGLNTPQATAGVTSSATVTQAKGVIIFTPSLPLGKREAVAATGCSETLKLALQFDITNGTFWPNEVEFFGLTAPSKPPGIDNVDPLLLEAFPTGTTPHSIILGDAPHIEIVNLHKFRNNGILILEVENALARNWSAYTNQTQLILSEVMPLVRSSFCHRAAFTDSAVPCQVPQMPVWFAINNYIRNPHIRCGFSYWRPGRDGSDNLLLRVGLWPDRSKQPANSADLSTAQTLFSPLVPSHSQHPHSLAERLKGPHAASSATLISSNSAGGNRLLFAGEHTSPDLYGTMHGAVVEGQRASIEVRHVIDQREKDFQKRLQFWRHTTIGRLWLLCYAGASAVSDFVKAGSAVGTVATSEFI